MLCFHYTYIFAYLLPLKGIMWIIFNKESNVPAWKTTACFYM
jgi:hypothetical protein